jgi:CRP-like cAMP-binding protein
MMTQASDYQDLKNFREYSDILKACGFMRSFAKDEIVCEAEKFSETCYFVVSGKLEARITDASGKQYSMIRIPAYSIFPLTFLNMKNSWIPINMDIVAEENTVVSQIRTEILRDLFRANPGFAEQCLYHKCVEENYYLFQLTGFAIGDTYQRIRNSLGAVYKRNLQEEAKNPEVIPLSQEYLAYGCGLSIIQLSRILQQMRKEGLIETGRQRIVLLRPEYFADVNGEGI